MLLRTSILLLLVFLLASTSQAFVHTDNQYLRISGKRQFIIGSYNLPPGIDLADLREAGFNFAFQGFLPEETWQEGLYSGVMLRDGMVLGPYDPTGPLIDTVCTYMNDPGLLIWHAPDEPAWQDPAIPAADIQRGYEVVRQNDRGLQIPRPVWLNHAARGTRVHPDSFELLREYNDCADIFSFDIYPVPSYFNGSILPDKEISSVGCYTEIMVDLLRNESGLQTKPVWMVLQGFSWTDFFFSSSWLSSSVSQFDFDNVSQAVAGDFTGDGRTDIALLYSEGLAPTDPQIVYVAISNGERFNGPYSWVQTTHGAFAFEKVIWADAGDLTGDGRDDLVLLYNDPDPTEKILVAPSRGFTFNWIEVWLDTLKTDFNHERIYGFQAGHFDDDSIEDLAMAYSTGNIPQARQDLVVAASTGEGFSSVRNWYSRPFEDLALQRVRFMRAGDFNGDGLSDLAFLYNHPAGRAELQVVPSTGTSFAGRATWWDSLTAEFPIEMNKQMTSQDLDGDERDDLVLFYAEADTGDSPQWLLANLSDGTDFTQKRWGVIYSTSYLFEDLHFAMGGDYDNDGLGDFCAVHDYTWPYSDPSQRLEVALSYGEKFGTPGPTPLQTRFMAYDAVINGATGAIWWGLFFSGGPYDVWEGVSQTASELSALQEVLILNDCSEGLSCSHPSVELKLKGGLYGTYCLLAANASGEPSFATISGAPLGRVGRANVVFEDRALTVSDSSFSDSFGPWEVHVYGFGVASDVEGPITPDGLAPRLACSPNPFARGTSFTFTQPRAGRVNLAVYDTEGRLVRRLADRELGHGAHIVDWDGRSSSGTPVPSGIYYCRLVGPGLDLTQKLLRVR